jgi:pantoate--beta-alanine ligase
MKTIQKTVSFKEEIWNLKRNGRRIALVPTMGNIHDGHLDLVRQAKCSGEDITVICNSEIADPISILIHGLW